MLTLHAPSPHDADDLLAFETANRRYFEQLINARPASYYAPQGVAQAIEQAMRDAERDLGYQYLVRDAAGTLVGRVNLSRVRRAHFHSAELGYRIAQAAGGRGHASDAVGQVLAKAFGELGLLRLEACCRPDHAASLKVLARHGFSPFGRSTRSFELGGQWHDLLHFERHAQAA